MYDDEIYYSEEDYKEQHELEIRDIIIKAVNDKIKATVEELERCNTEIEKIRETNRELNRKLWEADQSKAKALKEKEHETLQKFCAGFAPHDVVYRIETKTTNIKCEKCNGKGKVPIEVLGVIKEVSCPHCSYGNIYKYSYAPKKDVVSSVYFNIYRADRYNKNSGANMGEIKVYLDNYDSDFKATQLYKTLEECQKVCDEKNKEQEEKFNKK